MLQIELRSEEYIEARRLLAFLQWFLPVGTEWIPDNSILREFIGDSILRDFSLVVPAISNVGHARTEAASGDWFTISLCSLCPLWLNLCHIGNC